MPSRTLSGVAKIWSHPMQGLMPICYRVENSRIKYKIMQCNAMQYNPYGQPEHKLSVVWTTLLLCLVINRKTTCYGLIIWMPPLEKRGFFHTSTTSYAWKVYSVFATHCFEIRMSKLLFIFLQKTPGLHRIGWESRRGVTVDGWLARLRELLNQFIPISSQFQHLADTMERNGQPPRDMVAMFLIYFVLLLFLPDELVWFRLETLVSMIMISTRTPLANDLRTQVRFLHFSLQLIPL